jgi:rubrerythrin
MKVGGFLPVVADACAYIACEVIDTMETSTHTVFLGKVTDADMLKKDDPMTYAYYHQVKGGKTPPKASSYEADEPAAEPSTATEAPSATKTAWRCTICGAIVEMDELPEDFKCPVCGMGREVFERIEIPA